MTHFNRCLDSYILLRSRLGIILGRNSELPVFTIHLWDKRLIFPAQSYRRILKLKPRESRNLLQVLKKSGINPFFLSNHPTTPVPDNASISIKEKLFDVNGPVVVVVRLIFVPLIYYISPIFLGLLAPSPRFFCLTRPIQHPSHFTFHFSFTSQLRCFAVTRGNASLVWLNNRWACWYVYLQLKQESLCSVLSVWGLRRLACSVNRTPSDV